MAQRVVLHVGPRKTATTYLQRVLQALVRTNTIPPDLYPIRTRGRTEHNQVPGLVDLVRSEGEIGLQEDAWRQQDGSDAAALLRAVRNAPGVVLLSAEDLSVVMASGAQCVIDALAPAAVDVVVTARALDRVLPSSWQQHMRNGNYEAYDTYLALRAEERESGSYDVELKRGFWRAYRYGDLIRRWQQVARSVSLVTVPSRVSEPATTWRRFRSAADIELLPLDPPTIPKDRANTSMSGAETFALYGLNVVARKAGHGRREVKSWHRALIRAGWIDRPERGPRLGLPEPIQETVRTWASTDLRDLRSLDLPIHGDLADLECGPPASDPGLPDADAVAVAAGAALALLSGTEASALDH